MNVWVVECSRLGFDGMLVEAVWSTHAAAEVDREIRARRGSTFASQITCVVVDHPDD